MTRYISLPASTLHTKLNPKNDLSSVAPCDYYASLLANNIEKKVVKRGGKATGIEQADIIEGCYLSMEVTKKILTKLVMKNKLSKEELANKLQVTTTSLSNLMNGGSAYLIPKINLELVKIYCETDFYNNLKKNENSHIQDNYNFKPALGDFI